MPRPLWTGAISFGLVTIPVKVVSATQDHSIHFRQVHLEDLGRVRTRKVCELDGEALSQDEIGKGYELSKEQTVPITDEELDRIPLPTAKAIEIVAFVDADSVDPIRISDSYYLAIDGQVAAKPYTLLRRALERSDKVAVAKFAWHNRERLGLLRVREGAIVLHSMRWPDEIRSPESLAPRQVELDDDEIDRAVQLTDTMALDSIAGFRDAYRDALEELIAAKSEGRELPEPAEGEEQGEGKVVDLMAALNASVEAAKESRGRAGRGGHGARDAPPEEDRVEEGGLVRKGGHRPEGGRVREDHRPEGGRREDDRGEGNDRRQTHGEEAERLLTEDRDGSVARLPRIAPMLATPGRLPPPSEDTSYAYEVKQDGQRCMVYAPGDGSVELRSRSGADITPAYPELASLGTVLGSRPAVLDGEIVALDDEGRGDFQRLQPRMGLAGSPARAARMAAKAPVHLMLFDVVFLDTSRLTRTPYFERRAVLESLDLGGPAWSTPAAVVGHGQRALEMTRTAGFEGLVAKRRTSLYEPGVRSRAWIKIRHVRTEDIVVGGWLPGHGRLTSLPGALLMGRPAPGGDSATSAAWAPAGATTNA